jgi:hypothetical protein
VKCRPVSYEDVRELVQLLPFEQRAKLVEEELKTAGLTVIFGSNATTAKIVLQIHGAEDDLEVDEILGALAARIKQRKSKKALG